MSSDIGLEVDRQCHRPGAQTLECLPACLGVQTSSEKDPCSWLGGAPCGTHLPVAVHLKVGRAVAPAHQQLERQRQREEQRHAARRARAGRARRRTSGAAVGHGAAAPAATGGDRDPSPPEPHPGSLGRGAAAQGARERAASALQSLTPTHCPAAQLPRRARALVMMTRHSGDAPRRGARSGRPAAAGVPDVQTPKYDMHNGETCSL